tara:strand:+ start:5564 stop:5746 length:183 start_codon:yes stop_codon:yes gene_type:complete
METEQLLNIKQVAEYLNVSPRTIRRQMKYGLPHYKVTHKLVRYDKLKIDKWLEKCSKEIV